ncbi:hypothetical protein D0Z07_6284 [Hyphodiscus hymeniophilus]|uniref:TauD/TfdA-like domain-containing protein n=1 Tax=Hyphodiscus hymeniophilus TaxID=353542 RepID=A0A9P6VFN5_9HELO|nr:hypothetical protein D0Z07_6284 [Hyphodiscus hymeniophilus]
MLLRPRRERNISLKALQLIKGALLPDRPLVRHASTLTQIEAPTLSSSKDSSHIDAIHARLTANGVAKIRLGFADTKCQYLEQLIRQLHTNYGHGLPIDHSASRGWFWDVRPTLADTVQTSSTSPTSISSFQARSETMESFPWHTDCSYESSPPRYFALQVLQPDRCYGGILSILSVDQILKTLSPLALKTLSKPEFRIDVPPEFIKNDSETYIVGSLLLLPRFGSKSLTIGQLRFREDIITPLTKKAKSALEELKGVLNGPEVRPAIIRLSPEQLPEGSVLLIDNRRWLHARNEVKDPNRHLRRVRWDATPFNAEGNLGS